MVSLNPPGWIAPIAICGGSLFVAALVASLFAPTRLVEVWGLLYAGVALGVFSSVLVHPKLGSGERNLWPFEVLIFWVIGLIPAWIGLFVGRLLRGQVGSSSASNSRWRGA